MSRLVRQFIYKDPHSQKLRVIDFELPDYYLVEEMLGQGAYGSVVSAYNKLDGDRVAIKKVTLNGNPVLCQRTIREIKLLQHFNHPNIIRVIDLPRPDDVYSFNCIYIVQEFMPMDLERLVMRGVYIGNEPARHILFQILQAVKAMHHANVLHRDLKPANILMDYDCNVKICDFGLSRPVLSQIDDDQVLTQYVATRWYRAPELLLQNSYSKAIDMWSVGCVFAEILGNAPLNPGRDLIDQMRLSLEICGGLTRENLACIPDANMRAFLLNTVRNVQFRDLGQMYSHVAPGMIDLLRKMLVFDPRKRITAEEALMHPCFAEYDHTQPYPLSEAIYDNFFDFEKDLYTTDERIHRSVVARELDF